MRKLILFCALLSLALPVYAQRQNSTLDSLIARFERDELTCQHAIDSFQFEYFSHPKDALAALYVARSFGAFSLIGMTCSGQDPALGLQMVDSEMKYLRIAQRLDPNVRTKQIGFTIPQIIGHSYGGRVLWHLFQHDTKTAIADLVAAKEQGGFSDALLEYSHLTLESLPPHAILFTDGDDDTFPLWYLQAVEGFRRDVTLVNLSLIQSGWYEHLIDHGVPDWMPAIHFAQVPGTTDTSKISDDEFRAVGLAGTADRYIDFPIDSSAMGDIAEGVGHEIDQEPSLGAFHASAAHSEFGFAADMFRRIVQANRWMRPICFTATAPLTNFNGIAPFVRNDGFVQRVFPDTGWAYRKDANAWVDSAKFGAAIDRMLAFLPRADSIMRLYLQAEFLTYGFYAYSLGLDSLNFDKLITKLRPLAQGASANIAGYYDAMVLANYERHPNFRQDVESIRATLERDLRSPENQSMFNEALYAQSMFVLHDCDALQKYIITLTPPYHSSGESETYQQIIKFAGDCK